MSFLADPNYIPLADKVDSEPVPAGQETSHVSADEFNRVLTGMRDLRTGLLGGGSYKLPSYHAFTQSAKNIGVAQNGGGCIVYGGTVYFFRGDGRIMTAPISDPETLTDTGKSVPGAGNFVGYPLIGDYLYMIGNGTNLSRAPLSDLVNGWLAQPATNIAIGHAYDSFAIIGDKAYLFGGLLGGTIASNKIYRAELSNLSVWTDTGKTISQGMQEGCTFIFKDRIFHWGGYNGGFTGTIQYASVGDPLSWRTSATTLPIQPVRGTPLVLDDRIVMIGWEISGSVEARIAESVDGLTWHFTTAAFPAGCAPHSAIAVIDGVIYTYGGATGSRVPSSLIMKSGPGATVATIGSAAYPKPLLGLGSSGLSAISPQVRLAGFPPKMYAGTAVLG